MDSRSLAWKIGLLISFAVEAHAQMPAVPAAPPAAPAVPAAAPAAPASGSSGGCLAGLCSALQGCKLNCCSSPLGQLLSGMVKPVSIMTGGVIPTPCSSSNSSMLAAAASQPGPAGAAAAIQQSEANAKARRAAVRYLGTVDCHYFPEAEAMLIAALRADTNECVRWEAAHAFANGCCCTKKTVEALTITVQASNRDGNPSEDSMRVRVEAYNALQRCLSASGAEPPVRPELPGAPLVPTAQPDSMGPALVEAKRTVNAVQGELRTAQLARQDRSLLGAWKRAKDPASIAVARSPLLGSDGPAPHIAKVPAPAAPAPAGPGLTASGPLLPGLTLPPAAGAPTAPPPAAGPAFGPPGSAAPGQPSFVSPQQQAVPWELLPPIQNAGTAADGMSRR